MPAAGNGRRLRRVRSRSLALAASLLAHLGLLQLAIASWTPEPLGPPSNDPAVITVTLGNGAPSPTLAAAASGAADEETHARSEATPEPSPSPAEVALEDSTPSPEPAKAEPSGDEEPGAARADDAGLSDGRAPSGDGAAAGQGGGSDPWAQASLLSTETGERPGLGSLAQACWQGGFGRTRAAVLVSLDEHGALVGSPRPLRPASVVPTKERLEMEGRIGAAVRKCAPYPLLASSTPTTHEVAFGAGVSD